MYTHGYTIILLYPWLIVNESNFLNLCLGAYFNSYMFFFNLLTMFSFPFTLKPSYCCIKISSSRSSCRTTVLTSSFFNLRFILVSNHYITQSEHIFTTSENVSSKSIPCFWTKPFTIKRALYFNNFLSSFFSLNTYLFFSAFLPLGSFANS